MAYSTPTPSDPDSRARGPLSPDDALPPVEPPSASFILQLFIVPGVIVAIIVCVWLLFNWLAQMGNDPKAYVDAIKRNNEGRWQAAVNLANALNNERGVGFKELRNDRKIVQDLAGILEEEIADGSVNDEKPITFRIYLCTVLGSFEVDDGLPALIQAATTNRDPAETAVQRSAIQAIALLAENVRKVDPSHSFDDPALTAALLKTSQDKDPLVRESAAFTLGVIGTDPLLARLQLMAEDAYPNARYNAATGLARHGDAAATETLLEMLDPDEDAGVKIEEKQGRDYKRALIQFNALRAVETLLKNNPQLDKSQFISAVEKLLNSKPPKNVTVEAEELLRSMQSTQAEREPATTAS